MLVAALAAFFAVAEVDTIFLTGPLGLEVTVLTVEPLTTTLLLALDAVVVAVIFLVGALVTMAVFFVVKALAGLVTTVAAVDAALCSDVLDLIEA